MAKELISSSMIVIRDGKDIEIDIDGYIIFSVDRKYGADADGNRAVSRTFVEDLEDLCAYNIGDEFILTDNEKEQAAEQLTRKFLEG